MRESSDRRNLRGSDRKNQPGLPSSCVTSVVRYYTLERFDTKWVSHTLPRTPTHLTLLQTPTLPTGVSLVLEPVGTRGLVSYLGKGQDRVSEGPPVQG